ncbi:hypothetical protein [Rhizobium sp.]
MVQVVTVSANTAAYAAEVLKPSARVSGMSPSEKTVHALAAEARKSGDYEQKALLNVVAPPALALFFLTAEKQPDNTLERAQLEYLHILEERRADEEEAREDTNDGG